MRNILSSVAGAMIAVGLFIMGAGAGAAAAAWSQRSGGEVQPLPSIEEYAAALPPVDYARVYSPADYQRARWMLEGAVEAARAMVAEREATRHAADGLAIASAVVSVCGFVAAISGTMAGSASKKASKAMIGVDGGNR